MSRPAYMDRANAACMRVHGEAATVVDTGSAGVVIFNPEGEAQDTALWPGQSQGWQPSDQLGPYMMARTEDAGIFTLNATVTLRAADYRITRVHPAADGFKRLDLAPA